MLKSQYRSMFITSCIYFWWNINTTAQNANQLQLYVITAYNVYVQVLNMCYTNVIKVLNMCHTNVI